MDFFVSFENRPRLKRPLRKMQCDLPWGQILPRIARRLTNFPNQKRANSRFAISPDLTEFWYLSSFELAN
jgi:hypothetical protein